MNPLSVIENMTEEEHKEFAAEVLNALTEEAYYEVVGKVAKENGYD